MNNVRATVYQITIPYDSKVQFEICLEIGHDFIYCDEIFKKKIRNKLPLEPYYSSGSDSSWLERISSMLIPSIHNRRKLPLNACRHF